MMNIFPDLPLLNKISGFIYNSVSKQKGENFNKNNLNYGLFLLCWKAGLRVSEAIGFDYQLKYPRHKDLYLVKGKGQKERYVYVSPLTISELKKHNWRPNSISRISFFNFLKKVKEKMN